MSKYIITLYNAAWEDDTQCYIFESIEEMIDRITSDNDLLYSILESYDDLRQLNRELITVENEYGDDGIEMACSDTKVVTVDKKTGEIVFSSHDPSDPTSVVLHLPL